MDQSQQCIELYMHPCNKLYDQQAKPYQLLYTHAMIFSEREISYHMLPCACTTHIPWPRVFVIHHLATDSISPQTAWADITFHAAPLLTLDHYQVHVNTIIVPYKMVYFRWQNSCKAQTGMHEAQRVKCMPVWALQLSLVPWWSHTSKEKQLVQTPCTLEVSTTPSFNFQGSGHIMLW